MINRFKMIIIFSPLTFLISTANCFAWHDYVDGGDWNYYGSGRDHAYSAYIDRDFYVGPADYVAPDYVEYINGQTPRPIAPVPPEILAQTPANQPNVFTVYIPNSHGSYNAVVVTRSGEGFKGPQGEYYPEFPKVFQLQMLYGK